MLYLKSTQKCNKDCTRHEKLKFRYRKMYSLCKIKFINKLYYTNKLKLRHTVRMPSY